MSKNNILSSSEQYVKKSNRRLLIFGIVALLAFFFGLLMLTSGGKKDVVDETPYVPDSSGPIVTPKMDDFRLGGASANRDITLTAYPENVSLPNVVLGSSAEGIVTLTATKGAIRIEDISLAETQVDGFVLDMGTCKVNEVLLPDESCNIKVLWAPVSILAYSNYINIRWRQDINSYPPPEQQVSRVLISGQSTDSKDCVICEDKYAESPCHLA
jgi:hypothetical protein